MFLTHVWALTETLAFPHSGKLVLSVNSFFLSIVVLSVWCQVSNPNPVFCVGVCLVQIVNCIVCYIQTLLWIPVANAAATSESEESIVAAEIHFQTKLWGVCARRGLFSYRRKLVTVGLIVLGRGSLWGGKGNHPEWTESGKGLSRVVKQSASGGLNYNKELISMTPATVIWAFTWVESDKYLYLPLFVKLMMIDQLYLQIMRFVAVSIVKVML